MYIQRINTKQNGKVYPSIVLCHSYRENGKQKRKILATLTKWPKHVVDGLEKILKGSPVFSLEDLDHGQGKSFGALWVLLHLAKEIGLVKALGTSVQAKLALLQIMARCISQSSRLHIANFWPQHYAVQEVLKISKPFNEDHLYANLDWLNSHQLDIEKKLFDFKPGEGQIQEIYLYDVTSSYFEGSQNELAEYGYNRDKKKGKKQIVIGLLCDHQGDPVSIEVFKGNTSDLGTFSSQLQKLKEQFGVKRVVMVGDKGMIKSKQIDELNELEWHYITSISKAQIETLIKQDVIQMELFDDEPIEVKKDGIRYILRKNAIRSQQLQANRMDKIVSIQDNVAKQNEYLKEHPRAKVAKAIERVQSKIEKLKLNKLLQLTDENQLINLVVNDKAIEEVRLLDGCYVIKTELKEEHANLKTVHDKYKELAKVEHAFRTIKTGLEEVRPIFVRKESRTRGHVFVCMLAYKLILKLRKHIPNMDEMPTMSEMIQSLNSIHYSTFTFQGQQIKVLPQKLNPTQNKILDTLNLRLPTKLYAK